VIATGYWGLILFQLGFASITPILLANLAERHNPLLLSLWAARKQWITSGENEGAIAVMELTIPYFAQTLDGQPIWDNSL
jgi:hypothetical protein